jgi:SAM-dependent methyltransferase
VTGEGYEGFFGAPVASTYDAAVTGMFDPAVVTATVDLLAELAGDGRALELGIGTGRIALPLAARGVVVAGIDDSEPMVARLREKPGADVIEVTIGDFATTRVAGEFSVVYLVFDTIFNLVTQDAQIACFENAAVHLRPGGSFVIETHVPDLQRLPIGETIIPFRAEPGGLSFDVYDVVTQRFHVTAFLVHRERRRREPGRPALRLAGRARPDGADRGPDARATLRRLAGGAVHEPQPLARLGVPQTLTPCGVTTRGGAAGEGRARHVATSDADVPETGRRGAPNERSLRRFRPSRAAL